MSGPIEKIKHLLSCPQKIAIIIHQNPDGDALGSGIAMTTFLKKMGHTVHLISPDASPLFLAWMPGIDQVLHFDQEQEQALAKKAIEEADLLLCLDFPVLHRAGNVRPLIEQSRTTKIVLDHHPDHELFADIMWIDPQASATAILIHRLIHSIEPKHIDPTIATLLYLAIWTDTGALQQSNTNAECHFAIGDLITKGAEVPLIREKLSPKLSLSKTRFLAHMLLKRLTVMPQYHAAYFKLPHIDYMRFKLQPGDTSGMASKALEIEGISCAILLVEKEGKVHLSFRSEGKIPVNLFAQKHFGGGGHLNASGGVCRASLKETESKVRSMIEEEMPLYLNS